MCILITLKDDGRGMFQRAPVWAGAMDRVGMVASAACFVHCLLTPIVISLMSVYAHLLSSEEHVHRVLAVFVAVVGAMSLLLGACSDGCRFAGYLCRGILWRQIARPLG